jgi:hypothetical protein
MQRYRVTHSDDNPPQYLGGVQQYDVFYWAHAPQKGEERLIVKWADHEQAFLWWDFRIGKWRDNVFEPKTMPPDIHEVIMAMYECFAIAPVSGALTNGETK